MTFPEARDRAAQQFAEAKERIVACGVPPDVVDAALRPLWYSVVEVLQDRARKGTL